MFRNDTKLSKVHELAGIPAGDGSHRVDFGLWDNFRFLERICCRYGGARKPNEHAHLCIVSGVHSVALAAADS